MALSVTAIYGVVNTRFKLDTIKYVADSYYRDFLISRDRLFPDEGFKVDIFVEESRNLTADLTELDILIGKYEELMKNDSHISGNCNFEGELIKYL